MNIDVPAAAIEPFEPHGIPRLNYVTSTAASIVQQAVKDAFEYINSFSGGKDGRTIISGVRLIMTGRLMNAGAKFVRIVVRGPSVNDKGMPYCSISIHYNIPGEKRRHHVGGPIWSEGGFE